MSASKRIEDYLEETLDALEDDDFEVVEDERHAGTKFRAAAFKTGAYGIAKRELVFVFKKFTRLNADKLEEFVDDAYSYANQTRRSTWALGISNLLWVYAVALAEEVTEEVIDDVTDDKPKTMGFGYIALPVVYDAAEDAVHFYERSSMATNPVVKYAEKYLSGD